MAAEERSPTAGRPGAPVRLRWLLLGVATAAGVVVGALLALIHTHAPAPDTVASARGGPALTWAAGARRAPGFRLSDEMGRPVSLAALRGRPVIVTFIDPLCRNFCPLEAQRLNDAVRSLPAAAQPAIVAVSVNVYGDDRRNLLQDNRKWGLVPQWHWGVGPSPLLAHVWRRYEIGVLVTTKRIAGVTVHEVSHTEAAYLVDRNGYQRALFMWPFAATDVERSLRQLTPAAS